jgi:cysteinyl-tRNA synthetase
MPSGGKMSLRVYNTLSNRIETFQSLKKNEVGLYTCGPTVYDFNHIGNFRSYVFEDLVKRYLLYLGYRVNHVMNITDIEDKIINKAMEMKCDLDEVTGRYIDAFYRDLDRLNVLRADVYPRATRHIKEMIAMIDTLVEKGFAYEKGGSVYFALDQFPDYGRLANIERDKLFTGMRVDADEYERDNVQDFVLWKGKKEGEPHWDTRFGPGRPGWHIECSAMSMKYLGAHFDIHMGGVDNIFPHHENEIAQSQCATGEPFVNYWIHCQHLIADGQKMSKSLGNFYLLDDLIDRGYDTMAIRFLLISTHYRKLLNFTLAGLDQARQSLKRITDFIFTLEGLKAPEGETGRLGEFIKGNEAKFKENMDDDFNISGALGVFFEFIHQVNLEMKSLKQGDIKNILEYVERINGVLGIVGSKESGDLEREIRELIDEREEARKKKDYALADSIRDKLKERGVTLIDTPDGVRWKMET